MKHYDLDKVARAMFPSARGAWVKFKDHIEETQAMRAELERSRDAARELMAILDSTVAREFNGFEPENQSARYHALRSAQSRLGPVVANLSPPVPRVELAHWQHAKRGSKYVELGRGELQSSAGPVSEGTVLVAYRGTDDGRMWFRPVPEFSDGRFIPLNGEAS